MSKVAQPIRSETTGPLVTAVIPTRNRPELVVRAARSALAQSYTPLEVVVVVDGPDPRTEAALSQISDERLRVVCLTESVGGSDARNVGVKNAKGEWIAFLDDDDEWLHEKIEVQMRCACISPLPFPIISSRLIARAPEADYIWPRRLPRAAEPIADYLFCRKHLFQGEGMIQTSTILTKRSLLQIVPFTSGLKKHQDWDWILRASAASGAGLAICSDPLLIYHMDAARPAISNSDDWRFSLEWIQSRRKYVTRRAYAAFVLLVVASQAAPAATASQYFALLLHALKSGSPTALELALFAGMRIIPKSTRRQVRAALGRKEQ